MSTPLISTYVVSGFSTQPWHLKCRVSGSCSPQACATASKAWGAGMVSGKWVWARPAFLAPTSQPQSAPLRVGTHVVADQPYMGGACQRLGWMYSV